ncbi:MAG: DUF427 domain-containing protein [Spirochaetales bacterium]|nr:DUF427 domain-containing protein [Spirochaetales bacterium]
MKRVKPGAGQESVWDYPRPPSVEPAAASLTVRFGGRRIAASTGAVRVLETSHPPTYYIPKGDVDETVLRSNPARSVCEYKGRAVYYDVVVGSELAAAAAWEYPDPRPGFEILRNYVSFYASKMDSCFVGDERVIPQEGDFYGGWITSNVVGPFKGGLGTFGW